MDTELFMECEEEELEPWQQVDDSVEEDDDDYMDMYGEPVEDIPSPPPSETPPPRTTAPVTPTPPASSPAVQLVSSSLVSRPPAASSGQPVVAPPLILTQTAGGAFLLPAAPGTGNRQPILLTTQGFPVQTMMNSGGPLVLNLQPGQTVQPLTLFQSSSGLGQLVRPSMGVSPVLPKGQTIQARPAGGAAFSTVQLPSNLTICTTTSGAVNLQMTQVGGVNTVKLAGSPALPSGSANGVSVISSAAPSPLGSSSGLTSDSSRVVMSVEEFYYGTFEGDLSLRKPPPLGMKSSTFTCQSCGHLAENNLRLMQHLLQHLEMFDKGPSEGKKYCRYCYRQFSCQDQLQTHQDQVHGPASSYCMCRICEWAFENEPSFLNHMKTNHKPGEMPYSCQVCSYRSSFYSNVLQHFASFHRDSRFLMCVFCMKVTRNPVFFQQHVIRHQKKHAFHCNRCRLQFVLLKDKMQHKLENHRSFRRPAKLQGLPPGSKVTIRTYGKIKRQAQSTAGHLLQSPSSSLIQPINIKTEVLRSPLHKNGSNSSSSPTRKPIGRGLNVHKTWTGDDRLLCLECGTDASDLPAHYPTHVHCMLCPYSSCCSRAYAAHMIHHHVRHIKDKTLHKLPPPCVFLLRCSSCDFRPQTADQMADHLLFNPMHYSATCLRKTFGERDIEFCRSNEQQTAQNQNPDSSSPSWRSVENWKEPEDNPEGAVSFKELGGPRHSLSKNSDAIDFFDLMFPTELVELITNETNANAKISHFLDSSSSTWIPVTTHEIKGFIGLVVLMGIQNLPNPAHYWSWSHYDNSYTFYRAMSFKRFNQIAANICMGSFTADEHRGTENPTDSLHIFRPMLDILGGAMWTAYRPNCCLTIDRALLPSPEEESGAAKADPKTQPQVWLLCDSKSGYCHRFFIQTEQRVGQELGYTVVPELVKDLEDRRHQLYLANTLTSVPLVQKLLGQGLYASSSFPPRSPILPPRLWEEGRLERPGDFLQRQFGPLLATRWRDTKEMGCLSTNAAPGEADTVWRRSQSKVGELDPIHRPMAFRLLQENMRGVDICKQLLACNPLGGITQDRHWRSLFWFLINLSVVNAFIVLRESRKENPPAWVQDGLFTQVNFRKRLGNQLAKCAQKYFETMEIATSRRVKAEEEPPKQRHHMAKISSVPKRCKVCNLKNIRHETMYGCAACKASLCKQPSCFWEYHGMSPQGKESIKEELLKDRISGGMDVDEEEDGVDQAMAPVEDLDFSDDDRQENTDEAQNAKALEEALSDDLKPPASQTAPAETSHARPPAPPKEREDSMGARKLRVTLFALCDGVHAASRFFSTETQLVRSWLKEAKRHLTPSEQDQNAAGVALMVSWVLSMREQQLPITESNLFHKASMLKKKGSFSDSFRISYDWAVSFLLQHRLGPWSVGRAPTLGRVLPPSVAANVESFREFFLKVIHVHHVPESAVAAMDELCLFVDFRLLKDESQRARALEFTGSSPLLTVYLTVLSDGTVLPALVVTSRSMGGRTPSDTVLLEVCEESVQVEEMLDIWTKKVWLQLMSGPTRPCKSMLILDRHREHLGDQFLASISTVGTLPAVIPAGCSFSLQPLEVCVKPVLQRLLLSRWSKFVAGNPKQLQEVLPRQLQTNVVQLLLDWVLEALTHFHTVPHLLKKSFELTALVPAPKEAEEQEEAVSQKAEEGQLELLGTLVENLLGSDASEEDDDMEEEQGGDAVEASEEKHDGMTEVNEDERRTKENQEGLNKKCLGDGLKVKDENKDGKEAKMAEDSEEEAQEDKKAEEQREVNKERRETRIVIGEEVGDEWKLTVKSRTEAAEEDES